MRPCRPACRHRGTAARRPRDVQPRARSQLDRRRRRLRAGGLDGVLVAVLGRLDSRRPSGSSGSAPAAARASPSCSTPTAGPRGRCGCARRRREPTTDVAACSAARVGASCPSRTGRRWPPSGRSPAGAGVHRRLDVSPCPPRPRRRRGPAHDRPRPTDARRRDRRGAGQRRALPVYDGLGWLPPVLGAVLSVVAGRGAGPRAGFPRGLQPVAALLGLLPTSRWCSPATPWCYGLVPTGATLPRCCARRSPRASLDVEELRRPVPHSAGLVLLAVLGVGAIAVLVDALAVSLGKRRPRRTASAAALRRALRVLTGGMGSLPFALTAAGWLGLLLADGSDPVSAGALPSATRLVGRPQPGPGRPPDRSHRPRDRRGRPARPPRPRHPAARRRQRARLSATAARSTTTYNPIPGAGRATLLPRAARSCCAYEDRLPQPDYLRLTTLDLFDEDRRLVVLRAVRLTCAAGPAVQDGIPDPEGLTNASRTPPRLRPRSG